jgi:predicted SAM-dependent methyltransferase
MSAKRRRLAWWLEGHGIEIGALHRPLEVPRGTTVTYVDRLPVAELRQHYPELADQSLTPVSMLGDAQDLSAFENHSIDFVIANHLLEHLEYPIDGLLEFQRVLRPGGLVYLALPDKRVTFDRKRALTTIDHLLSEQRDRSAPQHRWDHFLDWAVNVNGVAPGQQADDHVRLLMARDYSIHFHVWRADTFLEFLFAARAQAGVELDLLQFAGPETDGDDEFILLLAKGPSDSPRLAPHANADRQRPRVLRGWRRRLARVRRLWAPGKAVAKLAATENV